MQNNVLSLQPINYYTLNQELCFFIGRSVANKYADEVDNLKEELLHTDCVTVCNHIERDGSDFYILMTPNYLIYADRSENNNFQVNRIDAGREFQTKKKYLYNQGVFLVVVNAGVSVVLRQQKDTSCNTFSNSWGMDPDVLNGLCNAVDEYFNCDNKKSDNKVDLKFEKQVLQPLKDYTVYEDLVEQNAAFGNNYIDYDRYEFVSGKAKKKVYNFYSTSFDPDSELYQVGEKVAVETNEEINDELKRKIKGTIIDRVLEEDSVCIQVEFIDQFDNNILVNNHGHIYPQVNDTQKRVRQNVIKNIVNGTVDSKYMYQLFSRYKTAGYEAQDGWKEFQDELMTQKNFPNKSQMEAIKRGIETKDIQLVLGPPGTGKTTVIIAWIEFFIRHGKRVLVSSQNNSAVDNVLERVGKNPSARIIRLGNINKIQENCKQYATERQVDKKADLYIERIKDSKNKVISDIEALESKIAFIDDVADDYLALEKKYQLLNGYKTEFSQLVGKMEECYYGSANHHKTYVEASNQKIHKEIYLFAIKKKNLLFRLLHWPVTRKVERDLSVLKQTVRDASTLYIQSLKAYNNDSKILQEALANAEYIDIKNNIGRLRDKCSNNVFELSLKGPLKVPTLDTDVASGQDEVLHTPLIEYQSKLRDIVSRLKKINRTLEDWEISINSKRNEIITDLLIRNSNVVGATCIGINTRPQFKKLDFDVSIIDESGQIQIHNAIVPMSRAPKTLMLGDHLQIPPIANDEMVRLCKQDGIKTDLLEMSFFEFLFRKLEGKDKNTPNITRLDEQFRMPSNISDVISDWFYEGNYHAHYDMSTWEPMIKGTKSPLILISTSKVDKRFEQDAKNSQDKSPGYCNPLEAEIIANIIAKVFEGKKEIDNEQVGVISAYGKQVRLIRQKIKDKRIGFTNEQIYSIAASLDSFQGQERPLIIYSSTRSTRYKLPKQARVGFMKELRRLNVAFTRCQKQLVIIGDFDYLTSCEYEEMDPETNKPLPNKSEKKYAEFMQKMVDQAKSESGEFYYLDEFYGKVGI